MDIALKVIKGGLSTLVTLFVFRLIGPLAGALSGWIVSLVFENSIFAVLEAFGVDTTGLALWQIGAALAFIGSFFTIVLTRERK